MSLTAIALLLVGLAAIGYIVSRRRAAAFPVGTNEHGMRDIQAVHSRPNYHGWHTFLWALIPPLALLAAWGLVSDNMIANQAIASVPAAERPTSQLERDAFINEVRGLISGDLEAAFDPNAEKAAEVYKATRTRYNAVVGGLCAALLLLGGLWAYSRVNPQFRARTNVERFVMTMLVLASMVAILTTLGIILSLIYESLLFFEKVSPIEFLFGTTWSPQTAIRADQVGSSGAFGAIPLFWGTIFIGAIIAMIVAIPLGLMAAIYLTQYAAPKVRQILKPVLEVLAGVPTVVYGYFAALTVAPFMREFAISIGITDASAESAIAAGLVMGIMIIPFVSSMADDAITAVPQAMRDGSLAMGATTSETIKRVLFPAALPGIVGGILLAVSRAIGETMIVVMAAGLAANLTINPFKSVTTVTAQIVALLTGDQEFDSAKTLSAFALGLVLFVVTLILNIYALSVVKKYREAYE